VRNGEVHKRLMLLAGISILDAPIARWFMTASRAARAARPAARWLLRFRPRSSPASC
jgi:hypothetical protein